MSDNKTEQKPVIRIENLHKYFTKSFAVLTSK